jgi:hypothetical protein
MVSGFYYTMPSGIKSILQNRKGRDRQSIGLTLFSHGKTRGDYTRDPLLIILHLSASKNTSESPTNPPPLEGGGREEGVFKVRGCPAEP